MEIRIKISEKYVKKLNKIIEIEGYNTITPYLKHVILTHVNKYELDDKK